MSRNGNKYCLTYCDYFSKYLIAIPLKDKSALTAAQALVEHVYLKLGLVEIEVSDLGREFINEIRSNIHKLLQIQPVRSVAHRPNINAAVERIHRTMHQLIMKVVDSDQRNWDKVLPYVVFAYNNATHSATQGRNHGFKVGGVQPSPFLPSPPLPVPLLLPYCLPSPPSPTPYPYSPVVSLPSWRAIASLKKFFLIYRCS
jgi:hypothetical protein